MGGARRQQPPPCCCAACLACSPCSPSGCIPPVHVQTRAQCKLCLCPCKKGLHEGAGMGRAQVLPTQLNACGGRAGMAANGPPAQRAHVLHVVGLLLVPLHLMLPFHGRSVEGCTLGGGVQGMKPAPARGSCGRCARGRQVELACHGP